MKTLTIFLVITLLALSTFMSWGFVLLIRHWSLKNNLLDIPNARSSHEVPIPKGGGLAIAGVSMGMFVFWLFITSEISTLYIGYLSCAIMITILGWVDDHNSLPARFRLLFQLMTAVLFMIFARPVTMLELPEQVISLGNLAGLGFSLLWIVGLTNAYNFMDGIDGIAASQSIVAGTAWMVIGFLEKQIDIALLAGLITATSAGFLFLNKPPAKIFMGDVGSTFLGFSFAAFPLLLYARTGNGALAIVGGILLSPFIFDSLFTIVRRALNGENILKAHRTHLYQRLVVSGFSHATVTKLYGLLALIGAACGISYYVGNSQLMLIALVVAALQCIILMLSVYNVDRIAYRTTLQREGN